MKEQEQKMNDKSLAFKVSEQMEEAISKLGFKEDKSRSEVLRACVCIGLPLLISNPSLIYRLDFSEFKINLIKD